MITPQNLKSENYKGHTITFKEQYWNYGTGSHRVIIATIDDGRVIDFTYSKKEALRNAKKEIDNPFVPEFLL